MENSRPNTEQKLWPILVLVGCLALLFLPIHEKEHSRLWAYAWDLAHFPLFAVAAVALILLCPWRARKPLAAAASAMTAALLLGLAMEWIQPLVGRTQEYTDLVLGAAGSVAAVCVYWAPRSPRARVRGALWSVAALLLLGALMPLALLAADRREARKAFPRLASFESWLETGRWSANGCRLSRVADHATDGHFALEIAVTDPSPYPGAFLVEAPRDWRGLRQLCVDIFLAGGDRRNIWIRLDDDASRDYWTRFQKMIALVPGSNRVCVSGAELSTASGGRPVDLQHVRSWGLFFGSAKVGDRLYVDDLELTVDRSATNQADFVLDAPAAKMR